MFSKAKRFPEVGKDYIPGPGEYDLNGDEMGRHKRYGFLTQTNRFTEGNIDTTPEGYEDEHLQNESTTTITSISSDTRLSSTSSLKSDEHNKSPVKKSPTSPLDHSHKQMEALLLKLHRMEATIEQLETEKNNTKSILLTKDLEMADLRSKNATLQKTIHRQEKSSKAAQLQKKVEQLEDQLLTLKNEFKEKNATCEATLTNLNRSNEALQVSQREKEALEAQNKSLVEKVSELEKGKIENETQINHLQQELKQMQVANIEYKQEIESLTLKNDELLKELGTHKDTISHLEARVTLKDEEIDALLNTIEERDRTIEEKVALVNNLQTQFKTYRHWIDHTVIPHLRLSRKETENHHYAELNLLLTELHEAKKFINRQAQYLNALKSDVHWLNVQNYQLNDMVENMIQEQKEFFSNGSNSTTTSTTTKPKKKTFSNVFKPKQKKQQQQTKVEDIIPMDASDTATLSFSSRSTVSNCNSTRSSSKSTEVQNSLDSNVIVLNDSGFGILVEEAK